MTSSVDRAFRQALDALQTGNAENAGQALQKVLRFDPRHVAALNLYGILLTKIGQFAEAERYVKRALQENSRSDASFYNYGVILNALRRPQEAVEQFNRALAINSSVPDTWNGRGEAYIRLEQYKEALDDFDRALAINPKFVDALVNKARALAGLEQYDKGLRLVGRALALQPDHGLAWLARANILAGRKKPDEALAASDRAIAVKPDSSEIWTSRGSIYAQLRRFEEAFTSYDKAIHLSPGDTTAWLGRGNALVELGRFDDALAAFKKALELKPDLALAYAGMGNLFRVMGRMDEANDALRRAIQLKPDGAIFYLSLVDSKKIGPDDPDFAAMQDLDGKQLGKIQRKLLDFALGKAYADLHDYRRSFRHYLAANAAERESIEYDEPAAVAHFNAIERKFTSELIAAKSGLGDPSSRPIFIIGMPRSGSTLVEQILASHSQVAAAGEVEAFPKAIVDSIAALRNPDGNQMRYPGFVDALNGSIAKSIGENYLKRLAALAPQGERATDKMLGNYLYAGLIHLALPKAIILHTVRDPVDTCISCFSKKFAADINYVYDLGELGRQYARYRRLMQHWHRVLPPGRILDVQYEEVVADLETQARRILSHCGLPWEEGCLAFHKTERPVRTASINQVRQPVYKSSVGRWHDYEDYLAPLLKELGIRQAADA